MVRELADGVVLQTFDLVHAFDDEFLAGFQPLPLIVGASDGVRCGAGFTGEGEVLRFGGHRGAERGAVVRFELS